MKILQKKTLKTIALWVKGNTKAINVFASIFFLLTFIAGIFWILGSQVEPVAFILSLCSSSLFGLPHLAEFILPTRKPIKNMTHNELLEFIKESDSKEEWKGISTNWVSEVFLKEDRRLRFRAKYIDEGVQNNDYQEEWANRHPDPNATGYWHDLYYDGNLIERFLLIAIDGGRAYLPPPCLKTGAISAMDYKIAQIHDNLGTLDQYIIRSKFIVDTQEQG